MDDAIKEFIRLPRCGNEDEMMEDIEDLDEQDSNRQKRSLFQRLRLMSRPPNKYFKHNSRDKNFVFLTYNITKHSENPNLLDRDVVEQELRRAMGFWWYGTSIFFVRVPEHLDIGTDIEIRFEKENHGDFSPFDGPGGTLAHAQIPRYGNQIHFDDHENWTHNTTEGKNLYQSAAHEIGHSLGLLHVRRNDAMMYKAYMGYRAGWTHPTPYDMKYLTRLYNKDSSWYLPSTPRLIEFFQLCREEENFDICWVIYQTGVKYNCVEIENMDAFKNQTENLYNRVKDNDGTAKAELGLNFAAYMLMGYDNEECFEQDQYTACMMNFWNCLVNSLIAS